MVIICKLVSSTDFFVDFIFPCAKECRYDVTLWNILFLFLWYVGGIAILSTSKAR